MDYNQAARLCEKLSMIPPTSWQVDNSDPNRRLYAQLGDLRAYLSLRTEEQISHQDGVLVGEGKNSEIVNLRIPVQVKHVKLEVVDTTTSTAVDSYEAQGDLPGKLYDSVQTKIHEHEKAQKQIEHARKVELGRRKLENFLSK